MNTVNISISKADIEQILSESPTFRSVVAGVLLSSYNLVQSAQSQIDRLGEYIKQNFSMASKIPAIKYVRQWAQDNNFEDLKGLAQAKNFVDKIISWPIA